MNERLKDLSQAARRLPPADRAALIDDLLASLDPTDARIDALWAEEAGRRFAAVDRGETPTRSAASVFAELRAKPRA